jgi:hypothetical protein
MPLLHITCIIFAFFSAHSLNAFDIQTKYGVILFVGFMVVNVMMFLNFRSFQKSKNKTNLECGLIGIIVLLGYVLVGIDYMLMTKFMGMPWNTELNGPLLVIGTVMGFGFALYADSQYDKKYGKKGK